MVRRSRGFYFLRKYMKEDISGIRITDKGACFGVSMLSTVLIGVLNSKRMGKSKTIEDIRDDILKNLEKHYYWLTKRVKDRTATDEEIENAKREVLEVSEFCKKTWDL